MDITYLMIVLVVILFSMTLHEAMHGFMSYWLGDDTAKLQGRLTLNPIKHIDPFLTILLPLMLAIIGGPIFGGAKPVPFNPSRLRYDEWGMALVAAAGPLTNFVIAFIFYAFYVLLPLGDGNLAKQFLEAGVYVNLGFFVFNMLPIPPLDGSRVMYALAPDFVRRGMEVMEQYGLVVVFIIVIFGSAVIGGFMQAAIYGILQLFQAIFGL
ncbi:MAG TPA: site-2 protease family protein [Candidatus Saccharibacteria bacterium]|nr:site-2 protease family protein [Candidatus Saccharibacteria bacterium]